MTKRFTGVMGFESNPGLSMSEIIYCVICEKRLDSDREQVDTCGEVCRKRQLFLQRERNSVISKESPLIDFMGHLFDDNLRCRCGLSFSQHQMLKKVCPKRRENDIARKARGKNANAHRRMR